MQQNRTTIQIRTATGLKTIAKEAIKKIDYAKGPSLEEKHAERERQKETERKREVEKAKDSERQKEMKVDVEAKSDLPSSVPERKKRWWIEPTISRGQGRFRSHLETVHRRLQTDLQILFRDDVYGMYAPEGQWRYDVSSHQSLTLRTGWDDWVLEVESVRHITQVKSWQYHSGQPHVAGSDTVFDYLFYNQMEGLREETLFWRVGYLFYKAKGISLTGFIGRRTLSGDATYSYVGQSRSLFPDGSEAFESILPVPSSLKSDGQGPEVGIEASLPMEKLTFVGRLSGYTQDIRSRVQEMFISSDDVSSVLSAVSESHRFNAKGSDVSLRVVYRIVYDVDVFLGYQVSQSQWEVRKVQDAYAFSYFQAFDEWSLFPPERAFAAQSLAPHLDRHMPGGSSRLVHVGISRRFWF